MFSQMPGHHVRTRPGETVQKRTYLIPKARRKAMLRMGIKSPKPDGSLRFSNDLRALNDISLFNSYPMPRVDELIN